MKMPILTDLELQRFWKKVNISTEDNCCWIWTAYKSPYGYGQIGIRYKLYLAHRVSYMIATGIDPEEKMVCHKCDNPPCVRPDHLFLGEQLDNMADMISKGRADHTKNLKGQHVGTAKLTEEQVVEIWNLHLTEGLGERKLAARFNVTPANIHCILSGQSWKHLVPQNPVPLIKPKNGFPRAYPAF